MKLALMMAVAGLVFHAGDLCAQDHAFASGVSNGEASGHVVQNSGPLSASAHYDSESDPSFMGSPKQVIADASVTADQVHKEIDLKAKATGDATMPGAADPDSGTASAGWMDHITLSNPAGIVIPADGFVGFNCSVNGTLSGSSRFGFVTTLDSNGEHDEISLFGNTPGSYSQPLDAVGVHLSNVIMLGMDLQISLSVTVDTVPAGTGDFSNTGKFLTLVVHDANGNPIPGGDQLVFTGASGFVYPVQNGAIPEPSTTLLLVLGVGVMAWRRYQTKEG